MSDLINFLKNKKIKYYDIIDSDIEENFHVFANKNCKSISPEEGRNIINEDSFEHKLGAFSLALAAS